MSDSLLALIDTGYKDEEEKTIKRRSNPNTHPSMQSNNHG
jgi:hypothetical protein